MKLALKLISVALVGHSTLRASAVSFVQYGKFEDSSFIYWITDYFEARETGQPDDLLRAGTVVVSVYDADRNKDAAIASYMLEGSESRVSIVSGWKYSAKGTRETGLFEGLTVKPHNSGSKKSWISGEDTRQVFEAPTQAVMARKFKTYRFQLENNVPTWPPVLTFEEQERRIAAVTADEYKNATQEQLRAARLTDAGVDYLSPRLKVVARNGALVETTLHRGGQPLPFLSQKNDDGSIRLRYREMDKGMFASMKPNDATLTCTNVKLPLFI